MSQSQARRASRHSGLSSGGSGRGPTSAFRHKSSQITLTAQELGKKRAKLASSFLKTLKKIESGKKLSQVSPEKD